MATNSPKYRDFFITINQGADCYKEALEKVKELNYKLYAFIVHDKDKNVDKQGQITLKKTHIHIMLEVKNPLSFNSMQERFKGARIDIPKYKKSAYQYLVHNSPNSRQKYQYNADDIISNDLLAVKHIIKTETNELFIETKFLIYINEGVRTPYQFVKRFGLSAYKQYWKAYNDMLYQLQDDEEMQEDLEALRSDIANDINDDIYDDIPEDAETPF